MNTPNPAPSENERIQRLVDEGSLSRAEADGLLAAAAELEQRAERVRRGEGHAKRPVSAAIHTKLCYLRGQVDGDQLREAQRRVGFRMGVFFGALMFLIHGLIMYFVDDYSIGASLAGSSMHLLLGGPLFGWLMYRILLRPAAERLIKLNEATGVAFEPAPTCPAGRCPTCAAENFKPIGPLHPMMLHWILNPALAFNELVLGQRIPKHSSQCKECGCQWVDCQSCQSAIDSASWKPSEIFGRWRGLACARCAAPIPSLRNLLAALLLLPFTVLGLFRDRSPEDGKRRPNGAHG